MFSWKSLNIMRGADPAYLGRHLAATVAAGFLVATKKAW